MANAKKLSPRTTNHVLITAGYLAEGRRFSDGTMLSAASIAEMDSTDKNKHKKAGTRLMEKYRATHELGPKNAPQRKGKAYAWDPEDPALIGFFSWVTTNGKKRSRNVVEAVVSSLAPPACVLPSQ